MVFKLIRENDAVPLIGLHPMLIYTAFSGFGLIMTLLIIGLYPMLIQVVLSGLYAVFLFLLLFL
ncbi:hypothetical protein [uncultured Chryseobacterium sp.]|uniref:hypothetical protein n=1 Tax=uncultured Chryseobacterium sp. TaxID=259322 RepID=UPI0025F7DEFD|nr:hypothetical protein [uncultured Chryseobacterium sp.]